MFSVGSARSRRCREDGRPSDLCPDFTRTIKTSPGPAVLYVSPRLSVLELDASDAPAPDIEIDGDAYRRLDPEYYVWLRGGLERVTRRHHAGETSPDLYLEILARFNVVRRWAERVFGQRALDEAVRKFSVLDYDPPGSSKHVTRSVYVTSPVVPE